MIDVNKAMLDPTMVFKDPKDVVANVELTRDQKIEILRRWEYDARQLEVAEEEAGMAVPGARRDGEQALHGFAAAEPSGHGHPPGHARLLLERLPGDLGDRPCRGGGRSQ